MMTGLQVCSSIIGGMCQTVPNAHRMVLVCKGSFCYNGSMIFLARFQRRPSTALRFVRKEVAMRHSFLMESPASVFLQTEQGWSSMESAASRSWCAGDVVLELGEPGNGFPGNTRTICVTADATPVFRLFVRWSGSWAQNTRFLGDHWERGYGDLSWQGLVPERIMPWYFLASGETGTTGYGVKTGPDALCFWQADAAGLSLCLDVRCGGSGVVLNGRCLEAATVVERPGRQGESPFAAATAFCRMMCESPLLPAEPVYGGNNWYYAYGVSSQNAMLEDAARIASWAPAFGNRPFMVVDACWQEIFIKGASCSGGPWYRGNSRFPDMAMLATQMREIGTRPGLWCRPLLTVENLPESWFLKRERFGTAYEGEILDPTVPEVCDFIRGDIARFVSWGYELVKHDFSTFDLTGRWGFQMNTAVTDAGWAFSDRSLTTARAIKNLYGAVLAGANTGDALVIGCNTIGHLAAGLTHIQRTGDDTSGQSWERTRKMGVNTLAFRMPQHNAFFAADADCVGLTKNVPWHLNRQWLDLLAYSGTPLFVSADPKAVGPDQERAIRAAFDLASRPTSSAEPLDWLETTCPSEWMFPETEGNAFSGSKTRYDWTDRNGAPCLL